MNKNMLNKVSTAGVVLSIAALVSLSGAFGVNAATSTSGYGYGYGSAPDFLLPSDDSNVSVNGHVVTKTGNDDQTSDQDKKTTTETKKDETPSEERVVKVNGDKVYSLNKNEAAMFAKILANDTSIEVPFTDISNSDAKMYIEMLYRANVVHGTTDTTFEPSRSITRAEFLAIVLLSHGYNIKTATSTPFTDLEVGDWKTNVVATALEENVIYGDTQNGKRVFRANDAISKIEALAILTSMRDIQIDAEYNHGYTDAAAEWQNKVLNIVEYLGLEAKSSKFNPNTTIARDDMAAYIVKAIELY